ncbi:hypothetical protein C4D60_Mb11t15780 [Musa balbisiana]|uniref:Uncharacterized protein n=1 Tax=Musa balbisiana TaxID=52838 RepID=A0A4V6T4A4_MUSBA|nr:hypothetical protein C4D60_Mb11t15780 [Musa balbisiana]
MALNSWHYLVAFLGEYRGVGIEPSRTLFLAYYRLFKGQGGYYLTTRNDFKISGTPSNNKGWKSCFFFISCSRGWGFSTGWTSRTIDNIPPLLSIGETADVNQLRGILSSSQAIREMTEEWLVEAGLSPTTRVMVIHIRHTLRPPHHRLGVVRVLELGVPCRRAHRKGCWDLRRRVALERRQKLWCGRRVRARLLAGVPPQGRPGLLPKARAQGAREERGWPDRLVVTPQGGLRCTRNRCGTCASFALMSKASILFWIMTLTFAQGQHYYMVLIDRVRDAGRVIEHLSDSNSALRMEILELKAGTGLKAVVAAKQCTSALDEEVNRLKTKLEESLAHAQMLDNELQTLSRDVESARSSAWATKETLKEEHLALLEKIEGAIAEYKSSVGFEHGLVRLGWVTYEFGYRVACAHFRVRYPDLELESDPFADQSADENVDIPASVPFDDGPKTPPSN